MLTRGRTLALTIVAAASLLGCANDEWGDSSPENQGFRWVGAGEPRNFGSAYNFCRQTVRVETGSERLLGGSGVMSPIPGGPTTVPGVQRSAPLGRTDLASRRQFSECMASQGWVQGEAPPPPS